MSNARPASSLARLRLNGATLLSVTAMLAAGPGCTASMKKPAVEAVTANPETRAEAFEATLRVLDENPAYVDEFFLLAKKHRPTMERFVHNTARDAKETDLAKLLASHLVKHPESLREVQIRTMEAAEKENPARHAIADAAEQRAALAAEFVTERPSAVRALIRATIVPIAEKPEARAAFIAAMHDTAPVAAKILVDNPKTLTMLIEEVLRAGGVDIVKKIVEEGAKKVADGDDKKSAPAKK